MVTLIQARPEWLVIPAVCVVFGTIFVIATIVRTRNSDVPLWKNEIFPVLMMTLERRNGNQSGPAHLVLPDPYAVANAVDVDATLRMDSSIGELRLLFQTCFPRSLSDWFRSSTSFKSSTLYHCTETSTVSIYKAVSARVDYVNSGNMILGFISIEAADAYLDS